ncbi:GRR1-like protein 1 [Capsicum annuum]|uniref:GRR1-like protein 1 n=1 Tax=Capsicum annuum TaxID=4072 RepID=UPI001FB16215|nr:GRR1-like protein 1 [Capsicum annuum]
MLPSRLYFFTGAYFAGIQADPDGVQINVRYAFGMQYQHIFSLMCHVHPSLMSFVLSHAPIRIPDLGMMIRQSYKLQRMRVRGYVDEIGLEDIATYFKDLETLGNFLMRKNRMYP